MNIDNFKSSIYEGMEFDKVKVSSKILQVKKDLFIYSIGSNGNYKSVSFEEVEAVIQKIDKNGFVSRSDYNLLFPKISISKPCNFTTIGGVLQRLKYVSYSYNKYCKIV